MAKTHKQVPIPPLQMAEVLASLAFHVLQRAALLPSPLPEWKEVYDGEAVHLQNVAEFAHREGTITKEQYEAIVQATTPF